MNPFSRRYAFAQIILTRNREETLCYDYPIALDYEFLMTKTPEIAKSIERVKRIAEVIGSVIGQ
jgi:hypothetical protein